ncbi:hypothetical protein [uncultured Maribacter sp.]|uniref:hypothetical protein n=1 Tax=uncultured Maribacter sp. TaxID=431308 RepID=UPI00261BB3CE|nr:hypothetical protein [uncultured Maribacter sp.]
MGTTKDYRKTIRMNQDLYTQVNRLAEMQNRNFSNFVVTVLKQTVEKQEEQLT